jgi:hypothetical protein
MASGLDEWMSRGVREQLAAQLPAGARILNLGKIV